LIDVTKKALYFSEANARRVSEKVYFATRPKIEMRPALAFILATGFIVHVHVKRRDKILQLQDFPDVGGVLK
jgi:hypothetical protein